MILKVIDQNLNEHIFNEFEGNAFTFSFGKYPSGDAEYNLVLSNSEEIALEDKVTIFNLFESLKNVSIKRVILENDEKLVVNMEDEIEKQIIEQSFLVLFDSNVYNLTFKNLNYFTNYQIPGNVRTNEKFDQVQLSFVFLLKEGE